MAIPAAKSLPFAPQNRSRTGAYRRPRLILLTKASCEPPGSGRVQGIGHGGNSLPWSFPGQKNSPSRPRRCPEMLSKEGRAGSEICGVSDAGVDDQGAAVVVGFPRSKPTSFRPKRTNSALDFRRIRPSSPLIGDRTAEPDSRCPTSARRIAVPVDLHRPGLLEAQGRIREGSAPGTRRRSRTRAPTGFSVINKVDPRIDLSGRETLA